MSDLWKEHGAKLAKVFLADFLRQLALRVALLKYERPIQIAGKEALRVVSHRPQICGKGSNENLLAMLANALCIQVTCNSIQHL